MDDCGSAATRGDVDWLLRTTNRMLRCRDMAALVDLAYSAIRYELGYDRVGLLLVDRRRNVLVDRAGTTEDGRKYVPDGVSFSLEPGSYYGTMLSDPRMGPDGPGYMYLHDAAREVPAEALHRLDGRPGQLLRIALRSADSVIGYFAVDNLLSGRPITADDAPPLIAFANALATALENVALLEERGEDLTRRVTEMEWLRDISRRVTDASSLDDVLDIVYDGIRDGLGYDRVGINLFDRAASLFDEARGTDAQGHKLASSGRGVTLAEDSPVWQIPGIAALLRGADLYYTPDASAETPPEIIHLFDGAPRHNIMVPLRSGDTVIGMISVDNLLSGRPIYEEDAGPLLALANQVGTAVENARLREHERAERMRLEVLLDSARALNSALDSDQIPRELAARLVTALGAVGAEYTAVDFQTRTCGVTASYTAPSHPYPFDDLTWDPLEYYPTIERVLATRRPYYWHIGDPGFPETELAYMRRYGVESELLVPVIIRGEAAAILELYWDRPVHVSPDTIALCVAVAEQTAVALERARLYADAAARAEHDALTGLANHRALLQQIDAATAMGAPFAVLLMDVDNFKLFNDTYGHPTGDAVLSQVAARLREACRDGDVAARYGGDEFALLLRGANAPEAAHVAQRLSATVRAHPYVTAEGAVIPLSISVGAACFPDDGRTRPELVVMADQAMYAAKRGVAPDHGTSALATRGQIALAPSPRVIGARSPRRAADLLGDSPFGVLEGLVNAVDAKDRYTREHSEDVTQLALMLARALNLDEGTQRVLAVAGPLHDVSKIAVPDRILRKPGRLSPDEYEVIKRHVAYGVAIIKGVLDDADVVEAMAFHHERWDGRGYPYGMEGPGTPLVGRIMQVADAVSAMTMDRPYRQGLSWKQVVRELRNGAGTQFDPELVDLLVCVAAHSPRACAS